MLTRTCLALYMLAVAMHNGCASRQGTEKSFYMLLLSSSVDGSQEESLPYVNIGEGSVWFHSDGTLLFEMYVQGDIPSEPNTDLLYGFFIDTDLDYSSGLKINDIGTDFNIHFVYDSVARYWYCMMFDMINTNRMKMLREYGTDGNHVQVKIALSSIGNPSAIRWLSVTRARKEAFYSDILPNTGHIKTNVPALNGKPPSDSGDICDARIIPGTHARKR